MPIRKLVIYSKWFIVSAVALLIISLITFRLSPSFAQTTPLDKADSDYAFQYGKYVQAHDDYLNAKNSFLTFKTATAKNDAFQKTKDYLKQVHAVYISYLLLTKEIGNTFDWGENSAAKNDIAKNLDTEISFFEENLKKTDTTQTLEDLPPFSADLSDHINKTTNDLINTTQVVYRLTETKTRFKEMLNLSAKLEIYAHEKLPKEQYDSFFANWSSEVKKIQTNSQTLLDDINNKLGTRTSFNEKDTIYVTKQTDAVLKQMRQLNTLFSEVLSL